MKKSVLDHPLLAAAALLTVCTVLALSGCQYSSPVCESCGVVEAIHPQPLMGQAMSTPTLIRTVGDAAGRARASLYHITVKMERSGGFRTVTAGSIDGLQKGAKVRIVDGRVVPASA